MGAPPGLGLPENQGLVPSHACMGSGFRTPTAASGGFPLCLLTLLAVPAKEQVTRSPQGDGSHVKLRPHRVVCGSRLLPPGQL